MADDKLEIPKEVSEYLGVKGDDLEAFKKNFVEKFIKLDGIVDNLSQDIKNTIFGDRVGSIQVKANSLLKKAGVEFTDGEIKDKKVEEVLELGFTRLTEAHTTKVKELEEASGKTDDEAMKTLQGKYDTDIAKGKTDLTDMTNLRDDLKTKYEDLEKTSGDKLTGLQMTSAKTQIDQSMSWASDAEFFKERKKAFAIDFAAKYKTTLGDEGNILVTDIEGKKIQNEDKAGEFMTYSDLLKKEAIEAKLIKINPKGGAPAPPPKPNPNPGPPAPVDKEQPTDVRQINMHHR